LQVLTLFSPVAAWPSVKFAPVRAFASAGVTRAHGSMSVGIAVAWAASELAAGDGAGRLGAAVTDGVAVPPTLVEQAPSPIIEATTSARTPRAVIRVVVIASPPECGVDRPTVGLLGRPE
jgi:hypothetical protein